MKTTLPVFLVLFMLGMISSASAQDSASKKKKKDLIINGSFEAANTAKLKKRGQFVLVGSWSTANEEKVDLFSKMAEFPDVGAPKNAMGIANPKDGDNYIGISTHLVASRDGRGYITAPLDGFLEKDKMYCLSYSISLADAAKYATNNLGFHFSKKEVFEDKEYILKNDVVLPLNNKAQTKMDGWEDLCVVFTAVGFEKYVTIGNFFSGSRTVTEKMDKPEEFTGDQVQLGYYFMDDISLVQVDRESDCTCEDEDEIEGPRIIFSKSSALKNNASLAEKVKASTVFFYSNEDDLVGATKRELDGLYELLEANPAVRITVNGHMDEMEVEKSKQYDVFKDISKSRAENVKQYLVDKGVTSSRIMTKSFKADQPATQMKTPLSLAKNRRVTFEVR
ncbi:MAG: OmpA family protein [Flavobacteriales bacterium]|nr:OmpA family protein [Flavobacteriales bacterium]